MKKSIILVLCCVLIMSMDLGIGSAAGNDVDAWFYQVEQLPVYYAAYAPPVAPSDQQAFQNRKATALHWNEMLLDYNFPKKVLRDVSRLCERDSGYPINGLGLEPPGGSNMRSSPDYSSKANVIHVIHGNETVWVYYSMRNQYNVLWYYASTNTGFEGYLAASRIKLLY